MEDIRKRQDILSLNQTSKDKLIKAFRGIQAKSPTDRNSFYYIASLHGQPFRGAGYANRDWWGGYCHHGNVLFPTWHRAYLLHLEEALRSIQGCEDVNLPYWNQMKDEIPSIFLQREYTLGNEKIKNPLYSYKLQQGFFDNLARTVKTQEVDYRKHTGYETVRYPYSGLVGPKDRQRTKTHNDNITAMGQKEVDRRFTERVKEWLVRHQGMRQRYLRSLSAPNYTVFSNTTSAGKYNDDNFSRAGEPGHDPSSQYVVSLESPHNGMHLAVGGYDMADRPDQSGANGDMGENDTSSFDPIFYFHHCFIDLVFWSWQNGKGATTTFEIEKDYPGTSSVDSQGPTPWTMAGLSLGMDTPLSPFEGLTSRNMIDIRKLTKLKYDYDETIKTPTSLKSDPASPKSDLEATPILRVSNIDRSYIAGSFVISVWAYVKNPDTQESEKWLVGFEPVFSRWHVPSCANCQNSLTVTAHIPVIPPATEEVPFPELPYENAEQLYYKVQLVTNNKTNDNEMVYEPSHELGKMFYW